MIIYCNKFSDVNFAYFAGFWFTACSWEIVAWLMARNWVKMCFELTYLQTNTCLYIQSKTDIKTIAPDDDGDTSDIFYFLNNKQ